MTWTEAHGGMSLPASRAAYPWEPADHPSTGP